MNEKIIKNNIPIIFLSIFGIFWAFWAFDLRDRYMWFIENVLMIIFLTTVVLAYKKFRFSNFSYFLFMIFLMLQTVGAHYTYEFVPFDWFKDFFNFERNNYDRIVHFSYGFLLAIPIREWYLHYTKKSKFFFVILDASRMSFGNWSGLWVDRVTSCCSFWGRKWKCFFGVSRWYLRLSLRYVFSWAWGDYNYDGFSNIFKIY